MNKICRGGPAGQPIMHMSSAGGEISGWGGEEGVVQEENVPCCREKAETGLGRNPSSTSSPWHALGEAECLISPLR